MQIPGFLGEETNIKKKENKLVLHSLKIIPKLVVDMCENCSNRLCQLLFNWIQINLSFKSSRSQKFHKIGVLISQNSNESTYAGVSFQ